MEATRSRLNQKRPSLPGFDSWGTYPALLVAVLTGLLLIKVPLASTLGLTVVAGIGLLVFVQPVVGIAFTLLAGPFGALENVALGHSVLDSGQLLFLVTVAAWLMSAMARRQIIVPPLTLLLPLALFLGVAALSLLDAPSLSYGLREAIKWLEIGIFMLLTVSLVDQSLVERGAGIILRQMSRATMVRLFVTLVLLAGLSQALIGIWQFGLRGSGPEHFQILGGEFYRAYGTFEQPNPFGGFMSWITGLGTGTGLGVLAFWWQQRRIRRQDVPWLVFVLVATGASAAALLFSWSRGAWFGFAAGFVMLLFFWPQKRHWGFLALLIGAATFLALWQLNLLPTALAGRITSFAGDLQLGNVRGADINDANYAVLERLAHWQSAVDMARENLWLGVGFGNYEPAYSAYALLNWPFPLGHAHNYYLNILAETGILGLLAYLFFWGAVFWQTIWLLQRLPWPHRGIALGLLATWTALTIHHLLDKLYVNNLYLHLGVMLGILQVLRSMALSAKAQKV